MADAKITKLGITDTVALEEAAKAAVESGEAPMEAPVDERRIVGKKNVETPYGVIVVENL